MRSLKENQSESDHKSDNGKESGRGREMTAGIETEENLGGMTLHPTTKAKEVMQSTDLLHLYQNYHYHDIFSLKVRPNNGFVWPLVSGRKVDDELDPMDPSAYSDAPK